MSGDLRHVIRQLRAHPAYTVVTVSTLALGIGLNAAIFSVVSAVLLEPLPYPHPADLVLLRVQNPNGQLGDASLQDYEDWQRDTRTFVSMGAYVVRGGNLGGGAEPPRGVLRVVTDGYFETMRIPLIKGRTLRSADHANALPVVLVSAGLARGAWPGQSAIGQRLSIGASPAYEVVGVVGDVKPARPDGDDQATAYFSFEQAPWGHHGDWGMDMVDLPTYAGAAMLVIVVSLATSAVPVVRALAISPMEALRS